MSFEKASAQQAAWNGVIQLSASNIIFICPLTSNIRHLPFVLDIKLHRTYTSD